jgi:pimeloyl-ACP methyl ester carboxylesterase
VDLPPKSARRASRRSGDVPGWVQERRHKPRLKQTKISAPVLTIGAPEFFGNHVEGQMRTVAETVERAEVFEECGHSVALEAEDRLAKLLREFMLDRQ